MCDPVSIIGLGFSIGMSMYNMQQQQDMASQQNAANDQWVAYQRRQSQEYLKRDEQLRLNAEAARSGSLEELAAPKQTAAQEDEAARLTKALTPEELANQAEGDPNALASAMFSGQQNGSEEMKTAIQGHIQQAAIEARKRIAALANVQSYGGSQYGLTNRANSIFNAARARRRPVGLQRRQGGRADQDFTIQRRRSWWPGASRRADCRPGPRQRTSYERMRAAWDRNFSPTSRIHPGAVSPLTLPRASPARRRRRSTRS
jgi:hypothetical protein